MEEIGVFLGQHGLNVATIILVLVSLFKDTIKGAIQRWLDTRARRAETEADLETEQAKAKADLERRAWERVLGNGQKADGFVDRLLLQQEHHLAAMRERDSHIERFVSVAVAAVRDAVEVMDKTAIRQEESALRWGDQMDKMATILNTVSERMAGIGMIMGLYLHDRQGVTFDDLIASIRQPIPQEVQQEATK